MHHHQDFKEVVLGKSTRPQRSGGGFQRSVESKLDNENEVGRVNTVGKTVGRKIQNARQAMNIKTRGDLAARINVRPSVIADYENGVAVPDAKIMQKLRSVLNTKL